MLESRRAFRKGGRGLGPSTRAEVARVLGVALSRRQDEAREAKFPREGIDGRVERPELDGELEVGRTKLEVGRTKTQNFPNVSEDLLESVHQLPRIALPQSE